MLFPISFPVYNGKIVVRVWDKRNLLSDIFIAQIPEFPKENDCFNINYLQSIGGVIPYSWVTIPPSLLNSPFLSSSISTPFRSPRGRR